MHSVMRQKEGNTMKTNRRSLMQMIRDFYEDEVYAFAMAYARGNVDKVRSLEDQLR